MSQNLATQQSIFDRAIEIPDSQERATFLKRACQGDAVLERQIAELLDAADRSGDILDISKARDAGEFSSTLAVSTIPESPGTQIGPYKLREQIGEGGFGVVYVAEQTQPVRRKVALKIIKPGMDTRDVIARFEAERQALALMDHPNIAKVLDAGTTGELRNAECGLRIPPTDAACGSADNPQSGPFQTQQPRNPQSGRPYFVMELVKGVPITEFCDERKLPTRERLRLFVDVCRAVQHAHQKGIIHRDLKPSNVMVTLHDDQPVVKVIDFGISKALSRQLTDKSVYTAYGQMIGTPLYMSPEQAQLSGLDVDTRSDVYSLGVLLYELLTGTTPFDKETLKKAGLDELRRIIREDDPPRPSARISTLNAEALSTVSDKRRFDARKLGRSLRGELDWIVMKALEKDRNRRYESASAFAADVERYLADEPVQARAASVWYRFRKFARRNQPVLMTTSVIALALLLVAGTLGWNIRNRAAREQQAVREREARQARLAGQVELILEDVGRLMEQRKWPEALAAAERAQTGIESGDADEATRQQVRAILEVLRFIDRLDHIRMGLATFTEGSFDYGSGDREYALAFREYGVDVESLSVAAALKQLNPHRAAAVPIAVALDNWAHVRRTTAKPDRADWMRLIALARRLDRNPLRDRLRKQWGRTLSPEVRSELRSLARPESLRGQPTATLCLLAQTLWEVGLKEDAISVLRSAQNEHPGDFWINFDLASNLWKLDRHDARVIVYYSVALGLRPGNTPVLNNLGVALYKQGKPDEAVASYRQAIKLNPKDAAPYNNLGAALIDQGKPDEAIAAYRQAIKLNPKEAAAYYNLGNALRAQKKLDEAVASYRQVIKLNPKDAGAYYNLGSALADQGKLDEAVAADRQAVKLNPKYAAAYNNLGIALAHQGKLHEAIACHRRAIQLNPKYADAYVNLGNGLQEQGKLDRAVVSYRRAIKLNPKFAAAYYNLGIALWRQGELDKAIASYRQAIKLNPKDAGIYNYLGIALWRQEKLDEAVASYRQAIKLNPNDAGACTNLAWALCTTGDQRLRNPVQAVTLAQRAVKLAPKIGAFWNTLGVAQYRNGDWKAAISALQNSMRLRKGGDSYDWYFLAMSHWQLGEKVQARQWYDRAIASMRAQKPKDNELRRFRAEAERLMRIPARATRPKP